MLQTTTDGKKTSVKGTLLSKVVWTVEFMNSEVLSWRKNPPETTDPKTMKLQKRLLKLEVCQTSWKKEPKTNSPIYD